MAASPPWKVYSESGEYLASFKYPEHAAALLASLSVDGTTIRWVHVLTVWTDGVDGHASESYDAVAEHCWKLVQHKTAKETIAPLPVIDDPVISDALRDVGL